MDNYLKKRILDFLERELSVACKEERELKKAHKATNSDDIEDAIDVKRHRIHMLMSLRRDVQDSYGQEPSRGDVITGVFKVNWDSLRKTTGVTIEQIRDNIKNDTKLREKIKNGFLYGEFFPDIVGIDFIRYCRVDHIEHYVEDLYVENDELYAVIVAYNPSITYIAMMEAEKKGTPKFGLRYFPIPGEPMSFKILTVDLLA